MDNYLYVFCPPPPDWTGPVVILVNALENNFK